MKIIPIILLLVFMLYGCVTTNQPTETEYKHQLKATNVMVFVIADDDNIAIIIDEGRIFEPELVMKIDPGDRVIYKQYCQVYNPGNNTRTLFPGRCDK